MPDGSQLAPCSAYYKTWRVRNDGPCDWPEGCHLVSAGGDVLFDPKAKGSESESAQAFRQLVDPTLSGEEIDITVELFAPSATGRHVGYFRLEDPEGGLFGQRLWSDIRVTDTDMNVSATLSPWQVIQSDGESIADETSQQEEQEQQTENKQEEEKETALLKPGSTVKLHSLQKRPELNGQVGSCKRWEEDAGRWEVELHADFRLVMLLPGNLVVWDESKEHGMEEEEQEEQEEQEQERTALEEATQEHLWQLEVEQQEQQQEQQEEEEEEEEQDEVEKEVPVVTLTAEEQQHQTDLLLWSQELQVLSEMGFQDPALVLPLLKTHISKPASTLSGAGAGAGGGREDQGLQAVVWALLAEP